MADHGNNSPFRMHILDTEETATYKGLCLHSLFYNFHHFHKDISPLRYFRAVSNIYIFKLVQVDFIYTENISFC